MSNVQPAPGWWRASDGNWYPPNQHPAQPPSEPKPPRYTPEDIKRRNRKVWATLGVIAGLSLMVGIVAMLESLDSEPTITATTVAPRMNDVGGNMALDGEIPADAICHDLPSGCTPRPTVGQAQQIEMAVSAVYPGVPSGKATDWAIYTCSDILDGQTEEKLIRIVTTRFAGGTRPDPTATQAATILDIIRASGFCV